MNEDLKIDSTKKKKSKSKKKTGHKEEQGEMNWNFSTDPKQPLYKPIPMSKIRLNAQKDLAKEKQQMLHTKKESSAQITDKAPKAMKTPNPSSQHESTVNTLRKQITTFN